jgi:iron complex transport system permease protein
LTPGRLAIFWGVAGLATAGAVLLAVFVGTTGPIGWPAASFTAELRLSRALAAAGVGIALAMAGVGYQAVLRNPLADPYLLGASGGAALAAFAWNLAPVAQHLPEWLAMLGQGGVAFVGAIGAVAIVLALAGGTGRLDPARAVLVGVVIGILCGGVFALLAQVFREPGGGALAFLFGRVPDPSTGQLVFLGTATAGCGLLLALAGGGLTAVGLGEAEARSLGLRPDRVRWGVLIVASFLAASATAVAGPVGFVGLMAPHLGRLIIGPDPRRLLPVAGALGAALLLAADGVGRYGVRLVGTQVPAGVITNLIGGPFFLLLLYSRRGRLSA